MQIKKLLINNFRAFKDVQIEFDKFNFIIGKNDSGKSTIFAALNCFFNDTYISESDIHYQVENDSLYSDNDIIITIFVTDFNYHIFYPYNKLFVNDQNLVGIRKVIYGKTGQFRYEICTNYINRIGKYLSLLSLDELKDEYKKISKDAIKEIDNEFNIVKTNFPKDIWNMELTKRLCDKIYTYYETNSEISLEWISYKQESFRHYLNFRIRFDKFWDLIKFKLYTSKTPICNYLNDLSDFYLCNIKKQIDEGKEQLAHIITELEPDDFISDKLYFSNNKIDLFTNEDSILLTSKQLSREIPLNNRGEGLQLKIKNAIFRSLVFRAEGNSTPILFAFEEPETHLHPSAQIEMYEILKKMSDNPNYQVFITTHSPYIVKQLAKDNIKPIVVKRDEKLKLSSISKLEERVLPYVSMNEINYIAFGEPSIEYHQELYGRIEIEWLGESNGNKIGDVIKNVMNVDSDFRTELICILKDYYIRKFQDKSLPTEKNLLKLYLDGQFFESADKNDRNGVSICYCVRNSIDHPCKRNLHFQDNEFVLLSTKMLYALLKTINLIKKDKLRNIIFNICYLKKMYRL